MDSFVNAPTALGVVKSLTGRHWLWRPINERSTQRVIQISGLPEMLGRLLVARNVPVERITDFLEPKLRTYLPDPLVLADMEAATERLSDAVLRREAVAIFGDYDVDGACAGALMAETLRDLGVSVINYVPDRLTEGYGPNPTALNTLVSRGASLIICVDCGTTAHDALSTVRGQASVVVLDHHASDTGPPQVVATVNPNRLDDRSGLGSICATSVVFLTLVALQRLLRKKGFFAKRSEINLLSSLDLVALATICDVVPLTGLNRAFVFQGLRVMARRIRPGIAALLEVAQAQGEPSVRTCAYALGPRINAAGRIARADLGIRTLMANDIEEASMLASQLDEINRQRQTVENGLLDMALVQAEEQLKAEAAFAFIAGADWHPGIVGIIAGRVKERFNRPALVFGISKGTATGSGRSVPGIDLGSAVIAARQAGLLIKGGGHAMAAGFTLKSAQLEEFRTFLSDRLAAASLLPKAADLVLDGALAPLSVDISLAQAVGRLGPFGAGNSEPTFGMARVRVIKADRIGRDGNTIRATIEGEAGGRLKAMLFLAAEGPLAAALLHGGAPLHLAGQVHIDRWNGSTSVGFTIIDGARA